MSDFDCSVKNNEGNTPAMAAAKQKNMDSLETILETFENVIDLDQGDNDGNSLLHILAKQGQSKMIRNIIDKSGDIGKQNYNGNTTLHILVNSSVKNKDNTEDYLKVVEVIVEKSIIWWCHRKSKPVPLEDTAAYNNIRKESVEHLRSGIFNEDGFSAISYAAFMGVKPLLKKMIQLPEIYVTKHGENDIIDITGFTPYTMKVSKEGNKDRTQPCCCPCLPKLNKVVDMETDPEKCTYEETTEQSKANDRKITSLLDTIVHVRPLPVANDMLSIIPLKQIVDNYWSMYQWIYAILLIAHLMYMTFLTVYGLGTLQDKHDHIIANSTANVPYNVSIALVIYLFTYPVLLILFFTCLHYIGTWTKGPKSLSWLTIWNTIRGAFQTLIGFVYLASLLAWILSVEFGVLEDEINVNYALG